MKRTLIALIALLVFAAGAPAEAAKPVNEYCTLQIVGQLDTGQYVAGEPECFSTELAANLNASLTTTGTVTLTSGISGYHFDGLNYTGSYLTVLGGACAGGWLNLPASWINRIESTSSGCNRVKHHDGYNQTGSYQSTWGSGNLSTLRNRANSISYWT